MLYVRVNGIRMAIQTWGDPNKPALILHHGGVTGSIGVHTWDYDHVAERFAEDFYVIALESRCHGFTGFPDSFTFDDRARDIPALMDTLCIEKAALLGVSAGTYIGGRAAVLAPDRFSHLILISGHSHSIGRLSPFQAAVQKDPDAVKNPKFGYAPMTPQEELDKWALFFNRWMKLYQVTPEQSEAAFAAMGEWDNRPGFATLNVPTLVMQGKYDPINPPEVGKEMASILPNAEYVEFDKSGHGILSVEQVDEAIATVKKFIYTAK